MDAARRSFLMRLALAMLATPVAVGAQQTGKVYRLGWLTPSPPAPGVVPKFPFLVERLRELGYVEGRNLIVEQRFGGITMERYPALVAELVQRKTDVIVVLGNRIAAVAAREAPMTPVVMIGGVEPVKDGLVASLARPGGNVTGLVQDVGRDVVAKQLQMLKELVPHASRVAVVYGHQAQSLDPFEFLKPVAATLGVSLQPLPVHSADDVEPAFSAMVRDRADAFLALPTGVILVRPQPTIELAARHRIPGAYWWIDVVQLGGLMSYGVDWADLARRAAMYVDKLFKGAKPGELPIEQPTKFALAVNLKTAKAIGLVIPPSLLLRADHIIE